MYKKKTKPIPPNCVATTAPRSINKSTFCPYNGRTMSFPLLFFQSVFVKGLHYYYYYHYTLSYDVAAGALATNTRLPTPSECALRFRRYTNIIYVYTHTHIILYSMYKRFAYAVVVPRDHRGTHARARSTRTLISG